MTTLTALAFADWRAAVNEARRVRRSPGRLAIWIGYAGLLTWISWSRTRARGFVAGATGVVPADYLIGALLFTLVLAFATGSGAVGIFRSRAEARFIIGSPAAAPLAIAYLQTRESLVQGLRVLASLTYALFFFAPREIGLPVMAADVALIVSMVAASSAVVVPRRLLSPRLSRICLLAGVPLGLLVLAPMIRDTIITLNVGGPLAELVRVVVPPWHPGRILLEPRPIAFVAAFVIAGLAVGALAALGHDSYPELYALALTRIDGPRLRAQRRQAGGLRGAAHVARTTPNVVGPSRGAAAFFWKSMLEFRCVPRRLIVGGALVWLAIGIGLARVARSDQGEIFSVIAFLIATVLLVFGGLSVMTLGRDLRNPLFWLGPPPFFERLVSVGVARIWRVVLSLEIVAAGFAVGGGPIAGTLLLALGFPALVALLAGNGFALFAFFPSAADQRGPVAAVRLAVSMLVLGPPAIVDGVGSAFGAPVTGLCVGVLVAFVEAAALVGVAAARLDGRMDRVAG